MPLQLGQLNSLSVFPWSPVTTFFLCSQLRNGEVCRLFVISLTPSKQLEFILMKFISIEPGAIIHEAVISEELIN